MRLSPAGMLAANTSLVTLASGTLLAVTTDFSYSDLPTAFGLPSANVAGIPRTISAVRSTDNGATWSETPIASMGEQGLGPRDPAIGPDGSVYVLISDVDGVARVWKLFRSSDDGASWSQLASVPLPDDAFPSRGDQSTPNIAVAADGTIGVLYDDHRNDTPDDAALTTDVWLTYSRDGGQTWSDLHLGGPFDLNASGSVEDYQALQTLGNGFAAMFLLGPCTQQPTDSCPEATDGPTDIFFARISF
jgi:hypothetical protein